jgi:hypothetical protein
LLTTTNFDIFAIGHTIFISRGLIDALPDEATLAAILAQPLADVIDAQASVDRFGFGDVVQVSSQDVMRRFRNRTPKTEIQLDNNKALELLKHSPYADKLANAGLFLQELASESKTLPELIHPSLGNQVYMSEQVVALGPKLEPDRLDQIAALPIGARVKLDPWTDNAGFLKAESVRPTSRREKLPFEITPFMPFLTRYKQSVELDSTEGTEETLSSVNLR